MPNFHERAATIKLAVFDVDGVFTDGKLIYKETAANQKRSQFKMAWV